MEKKPWRALWRWAQLSGLGFFEDGALRLAAALAFYSIFSVAPMLVIAIAMAGFFFGESAVEGQIVGELEGTVGREAAHLLQEMLLHVREQESGLQAGLIGLATLFFGAGAVFKAFQDTLNHIWRVRLRPDAGLGVVVRRRALAFSMILALGLLLFGSLIASTLLSAFATQLEAAVGAGFLLWRVMDWLLWWGGFTLLVGTMFRVLPDVEVSWRDVFVGAACTALLLALGKTLIATYLTRTSPGSVFGAAGTLVVLLVWIHYSWAIILLGAEMARATAVLRGSGVRPSPWAYPFAEAPQAAQPRARPAPSTTREVPGAGAPIPQPPREL